MDAASMIMGASIASIAWIGFIPIIRRSGKQPDAETPEPESGPEQDQRAA